MYIYKITNLINNKIYIGQTVQKNPKMRWYSHCVCARKGKKSHLYDSMRKHEIQNFRWEIVDKAKDIDELNQKEQQWLEHYRSITDVYNSREAGNNKLHNASSLEKMSESQKKAHARRKALGTDTWIRRDGGAMKGKAHPKKGKPSKKWSEEAKLKYSEICKHRKQREITPELKEKLANAKGKTWKLINGKRVWMGRK